MTRAPSIATGPMALVQDVAFVGQLMESLTVPVFVLDTQARVMIWNRACETLTGVPAREVLGTSDHWRSFYEVQRPTLADLVLRKQHDARSSAVPPVASADHIADVARDGSDGRDGRDVDDGGDVRNSADARNADEVRDADDVHNAADAHKGVDRHYTAEARNAVGVRNASDARNAAEAHNSSDLRNPTDARNARASSGLSIESWCDMPRAGRRRYLAADASPIFDANGELSAVVETLRDLTEEKMAQVALEQLATRDGLTGLANRRCFDDTLHAEWTRALRQMQPLSLLMVDVDNFKAYNDAHGHLGGDECLKRVARAVASEMRANDLVARYGGEEFAVILPNQSLKGAAIVAERIRCRVEQLHLPCRFAAGHVTVSIGAATAIAGPDNHASQLVAIADAALYRAKHLGRNRISLPMTEAA